MKNIFLKFPALPMALLLSLPVCRDGRANAPPANAFYRGRDLLGREVVLPKPPERIVSLAPSNTEIVFALGRGGLLKAVTKHCDYPAGAKELPRVGDVAAVSLERIVSFAPDLVLAGNKIDAEALNLLRGMSIPTAVTEGSTFEEAYRSILDIGRMIQREAEAERIVQSMREKTAAIAARAQGAPQPLCYYIVSFGDWGNWTAGPGSFIQEMIELAGGRNAGNALGKPWGVFPLEKLVALDPDILIAGKFSGPLDRLKAEPGYAGLTAVKRGRIVIVDDDLVGRPGPRLPEGLADIARAVHPDIFGSPEGRRTP